MSSKTNKRITKKKDESSSDEETKRVVEDAPRVNDEKKKERETQEQETKTEIKTETKMEAKVNSESNPVEVPKNGVTDFDYAEIKKLDVGSVKNLDMMELVKILIVRGKESHNPALWSSCERLLKQLSGEQTQRERRYNNIPHPKVDFERAPQAYGRGNGGFRPAFGSPMPQPQFSPRRNWSQDQRDQREQRQYQVRRIPPTDE